jgi:hypothetical protein
VHQLVVLQQSNICAYHGIAEFDSEYEPELTSRGLTSRGIVKMSKLHWILLLFGVIIVACFLSAINTVVEDSTYLMKPISETCPGVPEIASYNTTFFEETKVYQCSFLGYCSNRIDEHKTVTKMKERCKELQAKEKE